MLVQCLVLVLGTRANLTSTTRPINYSRMATETPTCDLRSSVVGTDCNGASCDRRTSREVSVVFSGIAHAPKLDVHESRPRSVRSDRTTKRILHRVCALLRPDDVKREAYRWCHCQTAFDVYQDTHAPVGQRLKHLITENPLNRELFHLQHSVAKQQEYCCICHCDNHVRWRRHEQYSHVNSDRVVSVCEVGFCSNNPE